MSASTLGFLYIVHAQFGQFAAAADIEHWLSYRSTFEPDLRMDQIVSLPRNLYAELLLHGAVFDLVCVSAMSPITYQRLAEEARRGKYCPRCSPHLLPDYRLWRVR